MALSWKSFFWFASPALASERQENVDPLAIAGGKRANGPVTSEHHAIPAKAFDGVIDVGTGSSAVQWCDPHRLSPGNLAKDIREIWRFRGGRAPGVEDFLPHLWHAAVVEMKVTSGQRERNDGKRQLAGQDAISNRKTVASQGCEHSR